MLAPSNGDYTLNFVAGIEEFFTAATWGVTLSSSGTGRSDSIDLLTAGISPLGTIGTAQNPGGTPFSLSLSGVTVGDTLTVRAVMIDGMDALSNPQSAFLDEFDLVPEPNSLALIGFGLLGAMGVRRRP